MIEAGEFISTGTCELPYLLSGEIKNYEDIIFFNSESFEREKGVKVLTSHLVEKIDRRKKFLTVKHLKKNEKFELPYFKLILCTGSIALPIPEFPVELENVFSIKSVKNLLSLKAYLSKYNCKKVLIIGSGYIGLETADAFKKLGFEITIVEKEKLPMPALENETRALLYELLKQNRIEFIGNNSELRIKHDGKKFLSIKLDGRHTEFDLVIVSAGVEPNSKLALTSKLALGKFGGIHVDNRLKTNDPNIYAAGDCIEIINCVTGKPDYFPLATIAQLTGHIAGENAAGGNALTRSFVKNIAVKLFGKSLASVGLNSYEAKKYFYKFSEAHAVLPNLVKVMPNSENIFGKIIYETESKKILGASFLGNSEVIGYADLISSFITNKIKAVQLSEINYSYTPPLSPFINLLSVLGRKIGSN